MPVTLGDRCRSIEVAGGFLCAAPHRGSWVRLWHSRVVSPRTRRPVRIPLAPARGVFSSGWRFLLEPAGGHATQL